MFPHEKRKAAVDLLLKYDLQYTKVIQELGYPRINALRAWYSEYKENQELHENRKARKPKYSEEQNQTALQYYEEHGRNACKTIKALGYPNRYYLWIWLNEAFPDRKRLYKRDGNVVKYTLKYKKQAVMELCTGKETAVAVAEKIMSARLH